MKKRIEYNGFWPKVTLSDGRVIRKESDLRPEERIIRLQENLETEELQAEIYTKLISESISKNIHLICSLISSGAWRTSPCAVIAYKRLYRENLISEEEINALFFLDKFYRQLLPIFIQCGLIDRGDDE